MRNFSIIFICSLLLCACTGMDDVTGDGTGSTLNEWVVPQSVHAGGEGMIQWNGFTQDASLSLESQTLARHELKVGVITASGLNFHVPASVPAGVYDLNLAQGGKTEVMGQIEVLEAQMPVRNLSIQSSACVGEQILIKGIGFKEDAAVTFADAQGVKFNPESVLGIEGLLVDLPEEMGEGKYEVYFTQSGATWLIAKGFELYLDVVVKTLKSISMSAPYDHSSTLLYTWEIGRELPVEIVLSQHVVEGDDISLSAYDSYISEDGVSFVLDHDGFESSNDLEMTYTRDSNGNVTLADVLVYGKSETTPFTWNYDTDGFLSNIVSPKLTFRSFGYDAGNLTVFRNTEFEYSDPTLVNHQNAADVVWGYMSMMEKNDPFVYFPYFLGWYTKSSAQLPTAILKPSSTGTGTDRYEFTYDFDEDGYVTEVTWKDGGDDYKLEFNYVVL